MPHASPRSATSLCRHPSPGCTAPQASSKPCYRGRPHQPSLPVVKLCQLGCRPSVLYNQNCCHRQPNPSAISVHRSVSDHIPRKKPLAAAPIRPCRSLCSYRKDEPAPRPPIRPTSHRRPSFGRPHCAQAHNTGSRWPNPLQTHRNSADLSPPRLRPAAALPPWP